MRKFINARYAPAITVGVLFFIVIASLGLRNGQDDQYIVLKGVGIKSFTDIFNYTFDYYMSWGGRAIICFIQMCILKIGIWSWRIISVLLFVLMIVSMVKLISAPEQERNNSAKWSVTAYLFLMFFITARPVLNDGIFWFTGSFHYAYTTSLLIFLFIPILKLLSGADSKKIFLLAYIPATIYVCNHEQSGAVLVTLALIANIHYYVTNRKISSTVLTIFIVAVASYIFTMVAPGNFVRLANPGAPESFFQLSIYDKFINGYNYTVLYHHFKVAYNMTILIAIMLSYLAFKNSKDKLVRVLSLLPIIYLLLYLVLRLFGTEFANTFFIYDYGFYSYYDANYLMYGTAATLIGTVILLIFPYLLYVIYGNFNLVLLFFAAIVVSLVNFLSADMELSGSRIYYTTDMIMLLISGVLFYDVWQRVNKTNIFFILAVIAVSATGIINYVSYVLKHSGIREYFLGY